MTERADWLEQKLDTIIDLLKHLIVLQLAELKTIGKAAVGQMLKGIKTDD